MAATPSASWSTRISCSTSRTISISPALAPLLCAGITTYSPLRQWNVKAGQKVGIVGLGGLGHMGLKFAHAFGAKTVLFTTSPEQGGGRQRLGADEVVVSKNADEMKKHAGTFDFILDAVSADHDINAYLDCSRPTASWSSSARRKSRSRRRIPSDLAPSPARGQPHRRHRRDAGDARFLR